MAGIKKRKQEILAHKVEFVINEPEKKIHGGTKRKSKVVSMRKYPEIVRRRRLNDILLNHCPSTNMQDLLEPEDAILLQRIAQETVTCGVNPMIRKKAIWALSFFPIVSTINVLTDLAESGEDEYIRSYALGSLGAMGVSLAVPLFVKGLKDRSGLINRAAESAIIQTVDKTGPDLFATALKYERNMKIKTTINILLQTRLKVEKKTKKIGMREVKPD